MLALCLMLSKTYHAQNYAGIIGLGLVLMYQINAHYNSSIAPILTWFKYAMETSFNISISVYLTISRIIHANTVKLQL